MINDLVLVVLSGYAFGITFLFLCMMIHANRLKLENTHLLKTTRTLYGALSAVYARVRRGETNVITEEELAILDPDAK